MKCSKLVCLCLYIFSTTSYGQHSEIGVFGGVSYYNGELNPSTPILNEINPAIGLFYRKNINTRYSLRFGANYAKLSASDEFNSTELSLFRQLAFSSNIIDAYGTLEFNFLPYQINHHATSNFSPYVFIGLAAFYTNPSISEANSNGLISSGTVIAPAIPFGAGIKFNFIENLGLSIEWTYKKTFTDQIDGLPATYTNQYQLSNTQNNDWYSFIGITLNYKFLTEIDVCPAAVN